MGSARVVCSFSDAFESLIKLREPIFFCQKTFSISLRCFDKPNFRLQKTVAVSLDQTIEKAS